MRLALRVDRQPSEMSVTIRRLPFASMVADSYVCRGQGACATAFAPTSNTTTGTDQFLITPPQERNLLARRPCRGAEPRGSVVAKFATNRERQCAAYCGGTSEMSAAVATEPVLPSSPA